MKSSIDTNILYRADCKEALQRLIDGGYTVDLIYLDPPFNSNRVYNMIYRNNGVTSQQKAFNDMWTITAQNQQLLFQFEEIINNAEDISDIVKGFLKAWIAPLKDGDAEDKSTLLYLIYMTERLILMKKMLKPTGSIYYHCDSTASHYIKIIMDGIFGRENFRNEIIWYYPNKIPDKRKRLFTKSSDTILFYAKDAKDCNFYFRVQQDLRDVPVKDRRIKKVDGKKVTVRDENGSVIYDVYTHRTVDNIWKIPMLTNQREYLGYPTQKPEALLNRIIQASCPEGGLSWIRFVGAEQQ